MYMYGRIISIQRIYIDYIAYFMCICQLSDEAASQIRLAPLTSYWNSLTRQTRVIKGE
jgi:hypothetical protein